MSESKSGNTIARERVDNLATQHSEPTWLKELRLGAWESYLQLPMPLQKEEEWRKVEIDALDLSALKTVDIPADSNKAQLDKLPEFFQSALKSFEKRAGLVIETSDTSWVEAISADLQKQGVVFCSLKTALEKHRDLVRPYLEKKIAGDAKFGLMNKALFNSGSFLYVPANVEVSELFMSLVHLNENSGGVALFPRVIVVLGANSKASFLTAVGTADSATSVQSMSNASIEIYVGDGAKLTYVELHKFGQQTFAIARNHYDIGRDGFIYSLTVGAGGGQIKADITTNLGAPGAAVDVEGVVLGAGSEHFSFNTIVEHAAPNCKSDINFRVALKDKASSAYLGTIRVAKIAQKTDSYQSNKNLLLGADAKADSIPKLEILADDVKCSHGATVGPVDKEQIFYLTSRGLAEPQAEELIVTGFFRKVFDSCTVPGASDYISDLLAEKIHAGA